MKLFTAALAVAFALIAQVAHAQDDKEELKKRILEDVEKKLKADEDQLLSDLENQIHQELDARGVKGAQSGEKTHARGFLGIKHEPLTADEQSDLGIQGGLRVTEVKKGSPADRAGLKEGDVIAAIDKTEATNENLAEILKAKGAGASVTIKILRDGKEDELDAKLGRHPEEPDPKEVELRDRVKKFLHKEGAKEPEKRTEPGKDEGGQLALDDFMVERMRDLLEQFGVDIEDFLERGEDGMWRLRKDYAEMFKGLKAGELLKKLLPDEPKAKEHSGQKAAGRPWLGVKLGEIDPEQRAKLEIEEGAGVAVAETVPDGPAAKVLKAGDIILKINDKTIAGVEGLMGFMKGAKAGQECELTIVRDGQRQIVKLTLGEKKE